MRSIEIGADAGKPQYLFEPNRVGWLALGNVLQKTADLTGRDTIRASGRASFADSRRRSSGGTARSLTVGNVETNRCPISANRRVAICSGPELSELVGKGCVNL